MVSLKISPKFTASQIHEALQIRVKMVDKVLQTRLEFIGEQFVKDAREDGAYTDQTGNLRNSIGYLILKDGVVLRQNFRRSASVKKRITRGKNKGQERTTTGSGDGVAVGKDLAYESAEKFPKGYVLIVVAGMDYAAAVESKGKDVLTGSSDKATKELKKAIVQITNDIGKIR